MSKTKVVLRVNTRGVKRGETVEVDKETADFLVDNGHGVRAKDAKPAQSAKD